MRAAVFLCLITLISGFLVAQPKVLFSEIMYDPRVRADLFEYVELFNEGSEAVNLTGWRIGGT